MFLVTEFSFETDCKSGDVENIVTETDSDLLCPTIMYTQFRNDCGQLSFPLFVGNPLSVRYETEVLSYFNRNIIYSRIWYNYRITNFVCFTNCRLLFGSRTHFKTIQVQGAENMASDASTHSFSSYLTNISNMKDYVIVR